jgi:hypothetical protein
MGMTCDKCKWQTLNSAVRSKKLDGGSHENCFTVEYMDIGCIYYNTGQHGFSVLNKYNTLCVHCFAKIALESALFYQK